MKACPHCGGELSAPAAHRGELERQLGDASAAANLRERARSADGNHGKAVRLADTEFVAWRGYVWAKVRVRKAGTCCISAAAIPPGAWAWRQLSEVRDRDDRVHADAWADL
ncbi:hypothetical protein [Phenylobacterium ferrooxidans]|uniref:Uncharacterized protein n=1 Tax=Phenylobacterium ferrooxidans TaxID=2982689 RepID=A0ABW6CM26_9CAUL